MSSAPRILAVDDNDDSLFALEQLLISAGYEVLTAHSGKEALRIIETEIPDIVLLDINMPGMNGYEVLHAVKSDPALRYITVVLVSANDELEDILKGLDTGADGYITKPFRNDELLARVKASLRTRALYSELQKSEKTSSELRRRLEDASSYSNIIGRSAVMQEVFDLVRKVLDAPVPVLISGESGTGKELVARAIHFNSTRRNRPFIAQNCAAFSESLLESELFGHVRGAFTGAIRDREGLFQAADSGTLFLDEIGEMALPLQAKLLRVLQDGTFIPVGENRTRKADVRVLAATNRTLIDLVKEGKFREDLYYRLNVVNIAIPPLRERQADIPLLCEHFLADIAGRTNSAAKTISAQALQILCDYGWPGNVRQLQNEMERAWILGGESREIGAVLLSPEVRRGSMCNSSERIPIVPGAHHAQLKDAVQELEKQMIKETLERLGGNKSEAARELGISRSNLIGKVQGYGLE